MAVINNNNTPDPNLIPLLISESHLIRTGFKELYNHLLDTTIFNAYLDISTKKLIFQRTNKPDLSFDFSLSGLPDVDVSAATSGSVLQFNGTNWVAKPIDFILNYVRPTQSTRFSDITNVSSVIDALDKILYPYQPPSFPSFAITSKPSTFELGQYFSTSSGGVETFAWSVSNINNVSLTNGYKILDVTHSYTLANAILPRTTTNVSLSIPYSIRNTANGATNTFRIIGKNTNGAFFQTDYNVVWRPKVFWGVSSQATVLNNSQIQALASTPTGGSGFASNIQLNLTMNGGGNYIWICQPTTFGIAINPDGSSSRFIVGGLANSFWNVFTTSYTNPYGFTQNYYLYRSTTISFGVGVSIKIV